MASAVAETLTDIFWLCPFEAIRIKQVSNPGLGMAASFQKVMTEEGLITGFYSGLIPLLCKQVPCKCIMTYPMFLLTNIHTYASVYEYLSEMHMQLTTCLYQCRSHISIRRSFLHI